MTIFWVRVLKGSCRVQHIITNISEWLKIFRIFVSWVIHGIYQQVMNDKGNALNLIKEWRTKLH